MTDKLKPCPFCGGKAGFIQDDALGLYAVRCKECGSGTVYQFDFGAGLQASKQKSSDVWNGRADNDR